MIMLGLKTNIFINYVKLVNITLVYEHVSFHAVNSIELLCHNIIYYNMNYYILIMY